MTAAYSSIGLATEIADIKAALNAKSLITAVQYEDADYLIFTTPLLSSSKVVKIYCSSSGLRVAVGSAWSSGTTITDEYYFSYCGTGLPNGIHVVADTTFFTIIITSSDSDVYHEMAYVGSLENGDEFVFGLLGTSDAADSANCHAKNLTDGVELYPITWNGRQFSSASGKIVTTDLIWVNSASGILEENGDGTPAGTTGVKVSSIVNGTSLVTVVAGAYLLTPAVSHIASGTRVTETSLIVEFS